MNLFFQPGIPKEIFHLDREESHHAVRVLRMKEGTVLELTDGNGCFYEATISNADAKQCEFKIDRIIAVQRKKYFIHIAIAPTKNADRIEWFVEKATEIGIDEVSFIRCQNSERKSINLERIQKVAVSAMKQSHQAWLPKVNPIIPFKEIISFQADQKFIAFVDSNNPKSLQSAAGSMKKYFVLIGPEGDFSNEELAQALRSGFEKVSLGLNRLRTETAGLAACHILNLIQSMKN